MTDPKLATPIFELPAPPATAPSSPPPQPRTWSRAVKRRRPKAPLLPPRKPRR